MTRDQELEAALRKLVDAIDRKWSLETDRRRSNAISPLMDEALSEARALLGISEVRDVDEYRERFR